MDASPDSNQRATTRVLGDYELLEEIARGGMGVIWKARHVRLGRMVALKMIRDSQLATPKARQRFQIEAEAAGKLHHPNIVPIYEFGALDGHPFISMLLVEGSDLARFQKGVPMEPEPLVRLMVKVAYATHFAHQRGILHRDLKPANILIDAQGEPHVTDFGLAKQIGLEDGLTLSEDIVGSPNYMAPEQASGRVEGLTTGVDVYSLGAIMYELLTGRAPFRAETPLLTLRKVLEEEPIAPRQVYKFANPDLETICLKCMEKNPDRRYTSARALAADLERWLKNEPIEARPVTVPERISKWVRRNPAMSALIAIIHVVLALGFIGIIWMSAQANERARESHEQLVRMYIERGTQLTEAHEDFTALLWFVEALRLDQGGSVRAENHRYRIASVLRRASVLQQTILYGKHIRSGGFSPDGRQLILGTGGASAQIWDADSGKPISGEFHLEAPIHRACFSPDGARVLCADLNGNARVWNTANGSTVTPILRGADCDTNRLDWSIRKLDPVAWFSPDGGYVLTSWACQSAHLWDAATGRHLRAFPHDALVVSARFSADGKFVATSGFDHSARVWDTATGQMIGKPLMHDKFVAWAQFSPDGQKLLTVSERHFIHIWDWRRGRELVTPMSHDDVIFDTAFSPDGKKIVSAGWDKTARIWDTSTGLAVSRLPHPGGLVSAVWNPDGRSVATSCEDGVARIWDASGNNSLIAALPHASANFYVDYSPNGKRLVTLGFAGSARVWDVSQADRPAVEIRDHDTVRAEFSRDGTKIVSASLNPSNHARVFDAFSGSPAGPMLQHTAGVRRASFSPDGRRVVTASDDFTARIWDWSSGRETAPALRHPGGVEDASFSKDGLRVATACYDGAGRLWDAATGKLIATLPHQRQVISVVFSPDGVLLATASNDHTVRVWDALTGQPISPPMQHAGEVNNIHFSNDGRRLLTAADAPDRNRGAAQIWEARSGKAISEPMIHEDDVIDAEFSPDERYVATTSQDHTARIWDARTGKPVTPAMWHHDSVLEAIFTRDGHRLITLSSEGEARLWDAMTGEAITTPIPHSHGFDLGHIEFSSDGKRLLIAAGGTGPIVREFRPTELPISALNDQVAVLTGRTLDASGGIIRLDSTKLADKLQDIRQRSR